MIDLPRIKLQKVTKNSEQSVLADKLVKLIGYKALQQHVQNNELVFVLEDLGIEPYDNIAVKSYMGRMLKEKMDKMRPRTAEEAHAMRYGMSMGRGMMEEVRWEWKKHDLSKYRLAVPVSALKDAARIAERVKGVDFTVHSLERRRIPADPFLSVSSGDGHEYFFAVWEEPTFAG